MGSAIWQRSAVKTPSQGQVSVFMFRQKSGRSILVLGRWRETGTRAFEQMDQRFCQD